MARLRIFPGDRFGKLTVIKRDETRVDNRRYWECKCECGKIKSVRESALLGGREKSCGCARWEISPNKTHGLSGTRIYRAWQDMRKRCFNPKNKRYKDYGGRGITVYPEWAGSDGFKAFYDYVSKLEHFGEEGYSLDRIDNDKGYEIGNLRWATDEEQANNKTTNHFVDVGNGEQLTLAQIMNVTGAALGTIQDRIRHGWAAEDLLQKPKSKHERAAQFDVGDGRQLTVLEIAEITGLNVCTINRRIKKGWSGEKLLSPTKNVARRYDVGNGQQLTVAEIANVAGVKQITIYKRLRNGLTGAELLAPAKK